MFRLQRMTEFGLLAMIVLAQRNAVAEPGTGGTDHFLSAATLARLVGVPQATMAQALKPLVRHNMIRSVRGMHGGYYLARAAKAITLLEIVEGIEGKPSLVRCESDPGLCGLESTCPMGSALARVSGCLVCRN